MFRPVWQIFHTHLFQAAGIVGRYARLPPDLQDYVLRQSQGNGAYKLTIILQPIVRPPPHTHTHIFTFSFNCTVNNCAVRSRVCWEFRRFVQLKFLDCVTLGTAEYLTAQFTLDCSVCCVLKAEAKFVLCPKGRSSVRV